MKLKHICFPSTMHTLSPVSLLNYKPVTCDVKRVLAQPFYACDLPATRVV